MRIIVIDNDYPNEGNLYGDVFVHVRIKEYRHFHECLIVSLTATEDFVYEGVSVKACATTDKANNVIRAFKPDIILIHFALKDIIEEIIPMHKTRFIVWVHGYEALAWYRRLFNFNWKSYLPHNLFSIVKSSVSQLLSFAGLIRKSNKYGFIYFVFVSRWMQKMCEADTFSKVKNAVVIPNPINIELFKYSPKIVEKRKHILMIRPFSSKKYATDMATDAIMFLSRYAFFSELQFTIIGKGYYFNKHTDKLKTFKNIILRETFLTQQEIKKYHDYNGIFLCPTRQDAQGVSMCEAMSSGLVPVTSLSTAIPEFVQDGQSGFLTKNALEIADKIIYLYNNPEAFSEMSYSASDSIIKKCAIKSIVKQELQLIEQQIKVSA